MSKVNGLAAELPEPQRQPTNYDAFQAAALLVGLYGADATDYAEDRQARVRENGDWAATRTWDLIASEIERLLRAAPS